eukprot:Protomagalhaensia_wolfi_Nauph_80__4120@NODE_4189_length_619_cov_95_201724_g3327_i0_p1_GENE_NODE_4189_length_619_cov_95_201724_g3327_i0NODE_4189_length_619_cov_95_201724_g3327_i0_p1_ORF_typecomplete_len145_score12_22_NODE_4189_length_619_cov_95_201724_g3327_i0119553
MKLLSHRPSTSPLAQCYCPDLPRDAWTKQNLEPHTATAAVPPLPHIRRWTFQRAGQGRPDVELSPGGLCSSFDALYALAPADISAGVRRLIEAQPNLSQLLKRSKSSAHPFNEEAVQFLNNIERVDDEFLPDESVPAVKRHRRD